MIHNIFSHEVENFDQWHEGFKKGEPNRNKHGIRIKGVYRGLDNPDQVMVHSEAENYEAYDNMLSDPEFQEAIKRSGVKGTPDMHVLTEVK